MKVEVNGGNLVITLPIDKKKSGTGKSLMIASTGGPQKTDVKIDGVDYGTLEVNVNAYVTIPKDKR